MNDSQVINKNSTDNERTEILSKKELVIVSWNQTKEMVITVGEIDISSKIKEALTNTGAHHQSDEGSLSDGGASFIINIPSFIADFKRDESIIIKNLPNGLLNDEQQQIKQKVLESDKKKETEIGRKKDEFLCISRL